jgi:hypothetical protein
MTTYILMGCSFGLGLLIAIWGLWEGARISKAQQCEDEAEAKELSGRH